MLLRLLTRNVEQRFRRYGEGGGSHYHRMHSPQLDRLILHGELWPAPAQITRDSQSLGPGFKRRPTGSSSASACIDQIDRRVGVDRRAIKNGSTVNLELNLDRLDRRRFHECAVSFNFLFSI